MRLLWLYHRLRPADMSCNPAGPCMRRPDPYRLLRNCYLHVLNYENDRNMPVVLSKLQFELLYLRVLVMYNSSEEVIITTPLTSILVAVE